MRSRLGLLLLLAFAASGATCKGGSTEKPPTKKRAEPAPEPAPAPAMTEIPGVDITTVPPSQRADFVRIMNETFCYCGCPRTLAACLSNRADCSCVQCSDRMTNFILSHFAAGMPTPEVEMMILEGFAEGYNGAERTFDLTDHPAKGSEMPRFTLVEFADFRCGHCKDAHPVLDEIAKLPGVRLVYFYYPLGNDTSVSMISAEAAEEARHQGKFWEMSDLLFENQDTLDRAKIDALAKQVGLDMAKFKKAIDGRVHQPRILADKKAGIEAKVASTPTVYINGRRFGLPRTVDYFKTRLSMETERGRCN